MRLSRILAKNQRGDTIVEVLIAVAIVSFVLAAAYASTSHNSKATIDAQEHSQALKAVETQLEFLHSKGSTVGNDVCFDPNPGATNGNEVSGANTAPQCTVAPYGTSTQPQYQVEVFQPGQPGNPSNAYFIEATWDSILGNGKSSVSMYYRPPPG